MDGVLFSCHKCRSQSPKADQQCDSCTSPQNPCLPWLGSQVYGRSQFHHPVTYVWAVGGRCWVQSLHQCCWGQVRTSLLLNLLQKKWLVGQRNNLDHNIWTKLQGCCLPHVLSGESQVERQRNRKPHKKSEFWVKSKCFLISSLSTSDCVGIPGVCLKLCCLGFSESHP